MRLRPTEPSAVKFDESNFTYTAPKELKDCDDLPAHLAEGSAVSCWKFSLWARIWFLFTGKLWFYCLSNGHPPIAITLEKPKMGTEDEN